MSKPSAGEITGLLNAIREGSTSANNDLIDLVYSELRAIASRQVNKHAKSDTLSPTALSPRATNLRRPGAHNGVVVGSKWTPAIRTWR